MFLQKPTQRNTDFESLGNYILGKKNYDYGIIGEVIEITLRYRYPKSTLDSQRDLTRAFFNAFIVRNKKAVIDYLEAIPLDEGVRIRRCSVISDIFLEMMKNSSLKTESNRKKIFDVFMRLFGGYFLLGAVLYLSKEISELVIVKEFQNIGTRVYDTADTYPPDVTVHNHFVFSNLKDGKQNLEFDKFTIEEILAAIGKPSAEKITLTYTIATQANQQIEMVRRLEELKKSDVPVDPLEAGGRRTKRQRGKNSRKSRNKKKHRRNNRSIKKKHRSNKRISRRR